MGVRVGLLVVCLLSVNWGCDARQLSKPDLIEIQASNSVGKDDNVCTLCEEYATRALDYLEQNKTQTEILEILHQSCSQMHAFKPKCLALVNHYAPIFFLEISSIQPAEFCRKVNLCQQIVAISSQLREDSCGLCRHAVSEVLAKLEDPDTQLDIIEVLLKACTSIKDYERKCKRIVLEYGPLFIMNAGKYLEQNDICTAVHACKSPQGAEEALHSDA